VILYPYPLR